MRVLIFIHFALFSCFCLYLFLGTFFLRLVLIKILISQKNLVAGGGEESASYTLEDIKELEKTIKDLCSSIAQNEYMCNSRYSTILSAFFICSY
jgi:hypothetical protein